VVASLCQYHQRVDRFIGLVVTTTAILVLAFLGGLTERLVSLMKLASKPRIERPETFSDPIYCVQFFGHPVIGAVLAYVLFWWQPCVANPFFAFIVGVSGSTVVEEISASAIALRLFRLGGGPRKDVEGG
jgi:hypothetical protein